MQLNNMLPQSVVQANHALNTIHALIVTINEYKSTQFSNLRGAVPDGQRVREFLVNDLRNDPSLIQELTDKLATFQEIVQAIRSLALPASKVKKGDPILIYFAGHGSTVSAPKGWPGGDSKIQVLVPHDAYQDHDGEHAHNVIPDYMLGDLLRKLADAKSDNITVILDCCHSTSGTRGSAQDRALVRRSVEFTQAKYPEALACLAPTLYIDEFASILEPGSGRRGITTKGRFLDPSMSSHVLLAACGEGQSAFEERERGIFTTALLDHFKSKGIGHHTYEAIISAVGNLTGVVQTPQCEGVHKSSRKLFDPRIHFRGYTPLDMCFDDAEKKYVLFGGDMHGVTDGTECEIYLSSESMAQFDPMCTAVVKKAHAISSAIEINPANTPSLPPALLALPLRGNIPASNSYLGVYFPDDLGFRVVEDVIRRCRRGSELGRGITQSNKSEATLRLALEGDKVAFYIEDEEVCKLGMEKLRIVVPPEPSEIAEVLQDVAHFFFYLRRKPKKHRFYDKVAMHIYALEEDELLSDYLGVIFRPVGSDLLTILEPRAGIYPPWEIDADDGKTRYGVAIENKAQVDLFLSMFYFDCGTLEIRRLYSCSAAAPNAPNFDAPLRAGSSLSLNYGSGGGDSLRFSLDESEDKDIGVLRVFLSNGPFGLHIEQNVYRLGSDSLPLSAQPSDARPRSSNTETPRRLSLPPEPLSARGHSNVSGENAQWDVLTLPILQTKPQCLPA